MLKVKNMCSDRSGREVPNQFIIEDKENKKYYFQSYNSLIAEWDYTRQRLTLGRHFDYSVTTSKYLHQWINEYCNGETIRAIRNAPGNSYSKCLQWCIDNGVIDYKPGMV
jgi:hypothetical protein